MNFRFTQTPYSKTGYFSKMVTDYLAAAAPLQPFYTHATSIEGLRGAMKNRAAFSTNRALLVQELKKQYEGIGIPPKLQQNIDLLLSENTFTITTAHQPNIFTGHLYFIYKIMHAIRLAEWLTEQEPASHFVPVFYMGSEDADLEELGHVYINGVKHEWKTDQTGAVGRMKVDKALTGLLNIIEGEIAVQPYGKDIIGLMKSCYTIGVTIEEATFNMVNALFGEYGLLVLLPDNATLKRSFNPIVQKELLEAFSHKAVEEAVTAIPAEYKVQAGGRELNLFYLIDDKRERIEKKNDRFTVVNTPWSFTGKEILKELDEHPERFSANVILRPVFQELVLPNVAFIGGGGEIAYWLELKKVFAAVEIPFPALVLRNSFLLVEEKYRELAVKTGFAIPELFQTADELLTQLTKRDSKRQLSLVTEKETLRSFYSALKQTAGAVDSSLAKHTDALHKKAMDKIEALEKKMLRAEKKKFEAQQRQLHKLKEGLFPHNNLQERIENFMPFYGKWGRQLIDALYHHSLSLEQEFVILEEA